jgi:hypothetical protein
MITKIQLVLMIATMSLRYFVCACCREQRHGWRSNNDKVINQPCGAGRVV